jgi:hypothetical protein
MEELVKLELIKIVLPPYDMSLPCQTSNFFTDFSYNLTQSTTCSIPASNQHIYTLSIDRPVRMRH